MMGKRVIMLRITGCRDPLRWYAGMEGSHVACLGRMRDGHWKSLEPAGFVNFVLPEDAQPVELVPGEPDRDLTTEEVLEALRRA